MEQELKVKITGDINSLQKAVTEASRELDRLGSAQKKVSDEISSAYQVSLRYERAIKNLNEQFKLGAISQSTYNSELNKLSIGLGNSRNQITSLQQRKSQLDRQIKATTAAINAESTALSTNTVQIQRNDNALVRHVYAQRAALSASNNLSRAFGTLAAGGGSVASSLGVVTRQLGTLSISGLGAAGGMKALFASLLGPAGITIAISAAVSLLTSYIASLRRTKEETISLKDAVDAYISSLREVQRAQLDAAKGAQNETANIDRLWKIYTDLNESIENRLIAIKQIIRENPNHFKGLKDEELFTDRVRIAYDRLRTSIVEAAKARAYESRITGVQDQLIDSNAYISNLEKQAEGLRKRLTASTIRTLEGIAAGTIPGQAVLSIPKEQLRIQDELVRVEKELRRSSVERFKLEQQSLILSEEALNIERSRLESYGIEQEAAEKTSTAKKAAVIDYEKIRIASENRIRLAVTSGRQKEIEQVNIYYEAQLALAKKNKDLVVQLQENRQAEIDEINRKWNDKHAAEIRKFEERRWGIIIAAVRKSGQEEIDVRLEYSRRINESITQARLRQLNAEYQAKVKELDRELRAEIEHGANIQEIKKKSLDEQARLQQEYWSKLEPLMQRDREMNIQMAFDGSAFSVEAARIRSEMDEVRRSFEAGQISVDAFKSKISDLSLEAETLRGMQSGVEGLAGAFSGLLVDSVTGVEDAWEKAGEAFKNVAKNIIGELTKIAIRYAINQAIGQASIATSTAASTAAASTVASSWATAAALVSAASYGANVAAGGAALAALIASTKAVAGFKDGGYTGNAGTGEIAGVVHGQEFVVNASATKKNIGLLQAMNTGADIQQAMSGIQGSGLQIRQAGSVDVNITPELVLRGDQIRILMRRADRSNLTYNGGM